MRKINYFDSVLENYDGLGLFEPLKNDDLVRKRVKAVTKTLAENSCGNLHNGYTNTTTLVRFRSIQITWQRRLASAH